MKVLTSPLFLRMTLALFAAAFAFVMAIVLMRRIRRLVAFKRLPCPRAK